MDVECEKCFLLQLVETWVSDPSLLSRVFIFTCMVLFLLYILLSFSWNSAY